MQGGRTFHRETCDSPNGEGCDIIEPMRTIGRRAFFRCASALAAVPAGLAQSERAISIVIDPSDRAVWAADHLAAALGAAGVRVIRVAQMSEAPAGDRVIAAGGPALARQAGLRLPPPPESLAIGPARMENREVLAVCGSDHRGLAYALLDLAAGLPRFDHAVVEKPANPVRSNMRLFTSEVEDKPWFYDRAMWPQYLTMLVANRFNRFHLAFGIGYDFLREVTDAYFLFAYPFFVEVPGYPVRVSNLAEAERERNLATLKRISDEATARGLDFQLGIWMHGYEWINSPRASHVIEGLTPENHGPYCRDALALLLKACPGITGVTFRIHGESGVAEGSYDFWRTVFDGVVRSGRKLEIDLHAKGIDQRMIDTALQTGMPVTVSPKFWAEHLGMPYHQAEIRAQERPVAGRTGRGLMALSSGSRSFTRYGYADLFREDRRYSVIFRIWPGTQRLLLWGDPAFASAYSRAFQFCGASGVDIMEPLSFKGRRGSGIEEPSRTAYLDASLRPRWDWMKYEYGYRVWGRRLYNPDAPRGALDPAEAALASASRILPIVTTAHLPSAANNTYWPEIYTNQPIVEAGQNPYTDTPSPKVFGNVSPLDPQLFLRICDYADEVIHGERSGKYSPVEVAQWLDNLAEEAMKHLPQIRADQRRLAIDVAIQALLGRFFAAKFRAGVYYAIFEKTQNAEAIEQALRHYRQARDLWAALADRAKGVYVADITVGELAWLRGHWQDRLAAIDSDLAAMEKVRQRAPSNPAAAGGLPRFTPRLSGQFRHVPPARFQPGRPLELEIAAKRIRPTAARLYYRRVNHAERFQALELSASAGSWRGSIPGEYTASPYPLQYYFEFRAGPGQACLYPGFAPDLLNQPYFVVRAI
jgi:hypothetical protein